MMRKAIYTFGFLLPPLFIGVLFALSYLSEILILPESPPLDPADQKVLLKIPSINPQKKTAWILLSERGTQITDALLAFSELSKPDSPFQVFFVAPKKEPLPLTGGLSVIPHFSYLNAPPPDLIVIPSLIAVDKSPYVEFFKQNHFPLIVALGEGVQLLGISGLLENKTATTHFYAFKKMKTLFPKTNWTLKKPWVQDGNIITSTGLLTTPLAIQRAIELINHPTTAPQTITYSETPFLFPEQKINFSDLRTLFWNAAYHWRREERALWMENGVAEDDLAVMIDPVLRTFRTRLVIVAEHLSPIFSKNGATLIPQLALKDLPSVDSLWIAPISSSDSLTDSSFSPRWKQFQNIFSQKAKTTLTLTDTKKEVFEQIAANNGLSTVHVVAKMMAPPQNPTLLTQWKKATQYRSFDWMPWLRICALSLGGLLLVWGFERRILRRKLTPNNSNNKKIFRNDFNNNRQ